MLFDDLIKQKLRLRSDQLSPAQKKKLWEVMARYKATPGFSYKRFFKEGFREWELLGTEKVKSDFIWLHPEVAGLMEKESLGFYRAVVAAGLWKAFVAYMSGLGMGQNQVCNKFGKSEESVFADYERTGVISIFREFVDEIERHGIK